MLQNKIFTTIVCLALTGCNFLQKEDDITSTSYETVCCYGEGFAVSFFGSDDERSNFGSACESQGNNLTRSTCDTGGSMAGYCQISEGSAKYYWNSHFTVDNAKVNCSLNQNSSWVGSESL